MGPAGTDPDLEAIVVSQETCKAVAMINEAREKRGLQHLADFTTELVSPDIHIMAPGQDPSGKKSSSTIRAGLARKKAAVLGHDEWCRRLASDMPYTVGITGGIACGKSTLCNLIGTDFGVPIIDCDKLGHKAYGPCLNDIVKAFGQGILAADGSIDRKKLSPLVFDPKDGKKHRATLNGIMWPVIADMVREEQRRLKREGADVVIVEAAVMLEAGWERLVDETWLVIASESVAKARLMARNQLSGEEALKRIHSVPSAAERMVKVRCLDWLSLS